MVTRPRFSRTIIDCFFEGAHDSLHEYIAKKAGMRIITEMGDANGAMVISQSLPPKKVGRAYQSVSDRPLGATGKYVLETYHVGTEVHLNDVEKLFENSRRFSASSAGATMSVLKAKGHADRIGHGHYKIIKGLDA